MTLEELTVVGGMNRRYVGAALIFFGLYLGLDGKQDLALELDGKHLGYLGKTQSEKR